MTAKATATTTNTTTTTTTDTTNTSESGCKTTVETIWKATIKGERLQPTLE